MLEDSTRAPAPMAVLLVSDGLVTSAPAPIAVLCDPRTLYARDCSPSAVLNYHERY